MASSQPYADTPPLQYVDFSQPLEGDMELLPQLQALYRTAFPGKSDAFIHTLFARYAPHCIRALCLGGIPVSMLFSIPYPVESANGTLPARYLYGIATHPDHRGCGYARTLLLREMEQGPIFLRPMTQALFDYYGKLGLTPFSPIEVCEGQALAADCGAVRAVDAATYLSLRQALAPHPCCTPSASFLEVLSADGGALWWEGHALALYARRKDKILFKEYWGEPDFAPRLTAFLGGARYALRRPDPAGDCFGVTNTLPQTTVFLTAMD